MRRLLLAVMIATLSVAAVPSSSAVTPRDLVGEAKPRGWSIIGGLGNMPPLRCQELPDCVAWLASGCRSALTGHNPGWLSSIVNVAALADGRTTRFFRATPGWPVGRVAGGVHVQFWKRDCREISDSRWAEAASLSGDVARSFVIPAGAKWMTVTGNDNLNIEWRLEAG